MTTIPTLRNVIWHPLFALLPLSPCHSPGPFPFVSSAPSTASAFSSFYDLAITEDLGFSLRLLMRRHRQKFVSTNRKNFYFYVQFGFFFSLSVASCFLPGFHSFFSLIFFASFFLSNGENPKIFFFINPKMCNFHSVSRHLHSSKSIFVYCKTLFFFFFDI